MLEPSGDQAGCVSGPVKLPVIERGEHGANDAVELTVQMTPPEANAIFAVAVGDHVGSDAVAPVLVTWFGVPKPLASTVQISPPLT